MAGNAPEGIEERLNAVLIEMGMLPDHDSQVGVCSCDETSGGHHRVDEGMLAYCLLKALRAAGMDVVPLE